MNDLKVIGKEHIGQYEFTGIEGGFGEGKRAMTVKDIAQVHGQDVAKINYLINQNRKRFKDWLDIIDIKNNMQLISQKNLEALGLKGRAVSNAKNIYLLSERGYSKLLKILEDDTAWDIYDQLVDNYFNMRQAINENQPALLEGKHLEIMEKRANTAQANALLRIAKATASDSSRQALLAQAAKAITGEMTIPVMKDKEYTAGQVGKQLGISANMVGRIANRIGLKAEQPGQNEYGRWSNSKSRSSDKEVPQWLYFKAGVKAVKNAVSQKVAE
ncbi:ORF6N domain-containing protein [Secundilactobacillus muriivasis]